MKNTLLALGAAIGALCTALPTHAVTLESATLNGNLLDSSFSTPSLIALDLTMENHASLRFTFTVDAGDIAAGSAAFNSVLRDVSGLGFGSLTIDYDRVSLIIPPGSLRASTVDGDLLESNHFAGATVTEFYFGNPFEENGVSDWVIGFAGLNAGDRFTLGIATTPAVPEPDDWAMMLAGLGMIALSAARRIGR